MKSPAIWELALGLSLLCMLAAMLLLPAAQRIARIEARIRSVRMPGHSLDEADRTAPVWSRMLGGVGQAVLGSGLLSRKAIDDLRESMIAAGQRSGPALSMFVGAKLLLFVGLPLLGWAVVKTMGLHVPAALVMGGCAIVGLMLPDYLVRSRRQRYLKAVEIGLPAALDLLIICAEAGMALEAGFERVAQESREGAAATASELQITANEMRMLTDRRQALVNMGKRTGLDSMTRLGSVLAQSLKYGTPLTQALRVLAAEMRQTMLTRFEARAARIPVLLTMPMIFFILPCVFLVVGGPAAMQVMQVMANR